MNGNGKGKGGWIAAIGTGIGALGLNVVQYTSNEGQLELARAAIVHQNELLRQCMAGHIEHEDH